MPIYGNDIKYMGGIQVSTRKIRKIWAEEFMSDRRSMLMQGVGLTAQVVRPPDRPTTLPLDPGPRVGPMVVLNICLVVALPYWHGMIPLTDRHPARVQRLYPKGRGVGRRGFRPYHRKGQTMDECKHGMKSGCAYCHAGTAVAAFGQPGSRGHRAPRAIGHAERGAVYAVKLADAMRGHGPLVDTTKGPGVVKRGWFALAYGYAGN